MAVQDWSPSEISKAKEYFLNGFAIKDIAQKVGRTPSATNKALTRFGIRAFVRRDNKPLKIFCYTKDTHKTPPGFDRNSLRKQLDNWVSFWKVCSYLGEQKICFYEQSTYGTELTQRTFLVNDKVHSASQMLLMANKIRVENKQSAFLVYGLSW